VLAICVRGKPYLTQVGNYDKPTIISIPMGVVAKFLPAANYLEDVSMESIKVHICRQKGRTNLAMRYVDPDTGRQVWRTSGKANHAEGSQGD
jgi:hypothetical protein